VKNTTNKKETQIPIKAKKHKYNKYIIIIVREREKREGDMYKRLMRLSVVKRETQIRVI
jgi:hypothetical protein